MKTVSIYIRGVKYHTYPFCENNFREVVVFKDETYTTTISFAKKDFILSWNQDYSDLTLTTKLQNSKI